MYITDKARSGTELERALVQKVTEVEYNVLSLGALLRGARYGPIERLKYFWMIARCEGGGTLLRVPLCTIKSWYAMGICRLLCNIAVNPVLALVATGRLTETDWEAMVAHEWFSYNYKDSKITVLPEKPRLVRRNAAGSEVREVGRPEIRPRYRVEFGHCGMSMQYDHLVWHRFLVDGMEVKNIALLVEQDGKPVRLV